MTADPCEPRKKAEAMAYALGIALHLRDDGRIAQQPDEEPARWQRVEPAPGAVPIAHGHGRGPEAASAP